MKAWSWDPFDVDTWGGVHKTPIATIKQLAYANKEGWAWAYVFWLLQNKPQVLWSGDVWSARGYENASTFADGYKALRALGMPDGTYVDAQFNPIGWTPVSEQPQPAPIPGTTLTTKPPKPVGPAVVPGTAPVTTPPPPAPTTTTAGGGGMLLPLLAVGAAVLLLTKK